MEGNNFSFYSISKYRQVLMGIGILGVLIQHLLDLGFHETPKILYSSLMSVSHLVYTEGFLFLSGFGLYYSFSKQSDIVSFYKKRVFRLFIPFVIMSSPFFALQAIQKGESIPVFLGHITSAAYWYEGNYCGMWYVAISLLLYALFPLIHKIMFSKDEIKVVVFKCVILSFVFFAVPIALKIASPDYYKIIKYGLTKMPIFIVGILVGFLSFKELKIKYMPLKILVGGVIFFLLSISADRVSSLMPICAMYEKFYFIVLLCYFMSSILPNKVAIGYILNPLRWLGQYTLEIYILHLLIYSTLFNNFLGIAFDTTWNIVVSISLSIIICSPIHKLIQRVIIRA